MKITLRCIISLLLALSTTALHAQLQGQPLIDSLLKELPKQKEDTNKVNMLEDIAYDCYLYSKPDDGIIYGGQEAALATKLNFQTGLASANNVLGACYLSKNDTSRSLAYFQQAMTIYQQMGRKGRAGSTSFNIGNVYFSIGDEQKAIEYYYKALNIAEEINDSNSLATCNSAIGNVYSTVRDYATALEYYRRSLKIAEANTKVEKLYLAEIYMNIGIGYQYYGDCANALKYSFQGIRLNDELGLKNNCANLYGNISLAYTQLKDYHNAVAYGLRSLAISDSIHNKDMAARALYETGHAVISLLKDSTAGTLSKNYAADSLIPAGKTAQLAMSQRYLLRALDSVAGEKTKELELKIYPDLAAVYELEGDHENALKAYKAYMGIRDSNYAQENNKKILAVQMKRDNEKKDSAAKAEQDKKDLRQAIVRNSILAGMAALLIFSIVVYRQRNKVKEEKVRSEAERKIAEQERARAERSEQFKQQFLANMSHEIRTPMNAVLGMTNLVMDTEVTPKQDQYLKAIKKSSENLLVIINDILDLSKLEAGKMELEKIPFRISEQLTQVYETIHFKAEEKGLVLQTEIDNDVPGVLVGDPSRLNQVLINLSANAIKFTDKGNVRITVKKVPGTESSLAFTVADTGIGIPADKLGSLFESFQQVDASTSRKYGGTGLGLSISKTLIELQGGKIEVKSEEGKGSEFSFTIAYGIPTSHEAAALTKETKIDSSLLTGIRILVAEDNDYNQIVIQDTLENIIKGVKVDIADNGRIAIEKLRTGDYDVILMDAQMPVMGGLEASEYIRKNLDGKKGSIPILALTASVLNTDLDKCIKAGMNDYVPKPFTRVQLLSTLAKYYKNDRPD